MKELTIQAQRHEESKIFFGKGVSADCGRADFVFTDSNIYALYKERIDGFGAPVFVMQAGEEHKNEQTLFALLEAMKDAGLKRTDTVLAFGGGVAGDLGGLASALYMRGVRFVSVPTTLLAQVDASVGGKTAIDFRGVKNLVGVFRQPERIYADPAFFTTLPEREIRCGLGEIVKHAALDGALFDRLVQNKKRLLDAAFLEEIVFENIEFKASVVRRDAYEAGLRACLNLGHTTAHAIELLTGLSHGESVLVGILAEADIALKHCDADGAYLAQLKELARLALGKAPALPAAERMAPLARLDKKNSQKDEITLTVPTKKGKYEILRLPYEIYETELKQARETL